MTAQMTAPLISICIPTRNRAETLRLTLENVLSEARPLGARVEVLVADNASTDHTPQVLEAFAPWIRYLVRPANLGYFGNLVGLATEMARGRLIWPLGDDDLILRGGLERALRALAEHPEAELFYLNYGWIQLEERNRVIAEADSRLQPAAADLHFPVTGSRTLERLEDLALLPTRNAAGIFCGMFCYLLPRAFFEAFGRTVASRKWDCFSIELDDIYPHAKVLMRAYHGRPVHLVAEPCLMQGLASWDISRWTVLYKIVPLLRLLDEFATLGLAEPAMARMREDFEATAGRNFARMVLDPETNQGLDAVLAEAYPRLAGSNLFWDRLFTLFLQSAGPEAIGRLLRLLTPERRAGLAADVRARLAALEAP
jgi:glycosyltransferase involved in cell wall biosynthesis